MSVPAREGLQPVSNNGLEVPGIRAARLPRDGPWHYRRGQG